MPKLPSRSPLSQAAFAHVMGVDRAQVTRWKDRGMPMLTDGSVSAEAAADWVRSNIDTHKLRGSVGARQFVEGATARHGMSLASAYAGGPDDSARVAARLLLPLLPEETVRAVVAALLAETRHGALDCIKESFIPPPKGVATWAAHDWFTRPAPEDADWEEALAELAAGTLPKVTA